MVPIGPDTNIYVIADDAEEALEGAWDCTDIDTFVGRRNTVALSIDDLAEKCLDNFMSEPAKDVYVASVYRDGDAAMELSFAIERKKAQKEAERVRKEAENASRTTSMHGLLSGGAQNNAVNLPDNLKMGNFNLQVTSLKTNPDGSVTVSGTIDAKQLGNVRK